RVRRRSIQLSDRYGARVNSCVVTRKREGAVGPRVTAAAAAADGDRQRRRAGAELIDRDRTTAAEKVQVRRRLAGADVQVGGVDRVGAAAQRQRAGAAVVAAVAVTNADSRGDDAVGGRGAA